MFRPNRTGPAGSLSLEEQRRREGDGKEAPAAEGGLRNFANGAWRGNCCFLSEGIGVMHSFVFRANAVLTFGITVLAGLCILASFTDNLHNSSPDVHLEVLNVDVLQRLNNGNDEAKLTLNITADLRSVFTWNTKQLFVFVAAEYETAKNQLNQVSLWDLIVERKEDARIFRRTRNKYLFIDQGSHLRGQDFNLTIYWNVMPLTGRMFTEKRVVTGFRLPDGYSR